MRIESRVGVVLGVLLCGVLLSAERAQQCQQSSLPANMEFSHDLARVLQRVYDRSPTFRAQCDRLARDENLHVIVRLSTSLPSRCRAMTTIKRYGRIIRADMQLPPGHLLVELVGHEFEHLLEQVEGLDLRALSRVRGTGVREVDPELFETDRAIAAGRVVAEEARSQRHTAPSSRTVPLRHIERQFGTSSRFGFSPSKLT